MMHGHEKSDPAIVAVKPANKAEHSAAEQSAVDQPQRSRWSQGRGPRGMRTSKARAGLRAGQACHRRWIAYGKQLAVWTRGRSRMRESRTYGSVRGALSNERPYRDRWCSLQLISPFLACAVTRRRFPVGCELPPGNLWVANS